MTTDDRLTADERPPADDYGAARRGPSDDLSELLADPAVWAQPPDDLEERVVEAIAAEASRPRRSR